MKYALIGEERREAEPGLSAHCPLCQKPMLAKCGEYNAWHWAHRSIRNCDTWWERETDWHRNWKNHFPKDWQEIVHYAPSGEKHIADVKTEANVVLEFQHSYLCPQERRARENFYRPMAWVVDGMRRGRDRPRFFQALRHARPVSATPLTLSPMSDECALFRDWADRKVPVFFDFGEVSEPEDPLRFESHVLWLKRPASAETRIFLTPVTKAAFFDTYMRGETLKGLVFRPPSKTPHIQFPLAPGLPRFRKARQPMSFRQYMARKEAARRRARF